MVDLYCRLTRPHFTRKDLQMSEKPRKFPLEHFALYGIHCNHFASYNIAIATQYS